MRARLAFLFLLVIAAPGCGQKQESAKAFGKRGMVALGNEDYVGAIENFSEAIRLDPNLAMAYNMRGLAWCGHGNTDAAIKDFSAAIRIDPKLAGAYYNRGMTRKNIGEFQSAIEDYEEAIRVDPRSHGLFVSGLAAGYIAGAGLAGRGEGSRVGHQGL